MSLSKEEALKDVKLFVLDMDGTFYLSNNIIEGSLEFIQKVKDTGREFLFFTNNASRVSSFYQEKLKKMGLEVDVSDIVTAGDVTIEYLKSFYPGKRVYLNGTPLLEDSFREKGICLVQDDPDVVIQSFDLTLTYDKLEKICTFVRNGVPFLATHMDTNCPVDYGFIPDCGAMCDLITSSTGVRPKFLGKPCRETMDMILKITGKTVDEIAFVGDRIYTDVATGVNNGAKGFLVLTGEADMQTVAESDVEPTCIYDSLYELSKYL
ncbi:MAG: HAD-IIA family hydrolase [Lachnospiraceae bacterium]|nr:HAD-IIA family hydrolase [Lachnospiraceae bacterium]